MCHYASDKRCGDFNLKMHQKRLAAWLCPGPLGSLQRFPIDVLAGFKGRSKDKGNLEREGEKTGGEEMGTVEGGGQGNEGRDRTGREI